MKFILAQIKVIATILLLGLFVAYLYFSFIYDDAGSKFANTLANIALLFFVLMTLVSGLCAVVFEKLPAPAPQPAVANAENTNMQNTGETAEAEISAENMDRASERLESLSAQVMNLLAESKQNLSTALTDNKQFVADALTENKETVTAALNNLMDKVNALSSKNTTPLNLALENINTRLDDLENKIISTHLKNADIAKDTFAYGGSTFDTPQTSEQPLYNSGADTSKDTFAYGGSTFDTPQTSEHPLYDANAENHTETDSSEYADNKGLSGFENELAELANLEIMNTDDSSSQKDFEEIDISKILENDVKEQK